jgi:hypothetical protein
MDLGAIPVRVEGPSTYILGTILAVIVGGLIKVWPALRKIASEGDISLRQDLLRRVHDLEAEMKAEREKCSADIASLHGQIHELRNLMVELTLKSGAAK